MRIWVLEFNSGVYGEHVEELLGVFETDELGRAALPGIEWVKTKDSDTWEAKRDHKPYPHEFTLYSLEVNHLYWPDWM